MNVIASMMAIAALACQTAPSASREARQAAVLDMAASAIVKGANLAFATAGIEARTLIIHSRIDEPLSDGVRCELRKQGFQAVVVVYGSHWHLWDLTQ